MLSSSWLRNWKCSAPAARRRTQSSPRQRPGFRSRMEAIEDRCLLSGYQQTNLVGYQSGIARLTDTNLNGWGMASMPNGDFVVANTFTTGLATFYSSSGHVLPQTTTIPGSASPAIDQALGIGPGGHPTGVVYNPIQPGHGRLPGTARPGGWHPDRHHRPVGAGIRRRQAGRRQNQRALL
jgi:hypothetical protein